MRYFIISAALGVMFLASAGAQSSDSSKDKELLQRKCTTCHGEDLYTTLKHTKDEWRTIVDSMIGYGADVSRAEAETIADYLAKNYAP